MMLRKIIGFIYHKRDVNSKEILAASTVALGYRILGFIFNYILLFQISKMFGASGVGIYSLSIANITILAMIGSMGFSTSMLRFVSQYHSKDQFAEIISLYTFVRKFSILIAIILSFGLFILSDWITSNFYTDIRLNLALKVVSFFTPFLVILNINVEFIRGLKQINISEFFRNVTVPLLNIIFVFILLFFFKSDLVPILTYGLAVALSSIFTAINLNKTLKKFKHITVESTNIFSKKEIISISTPMIITSFSMLIMSTVTTIMCGIWLNTGQVGIFSTSLKLSLLTSFVLNAINTISAPKISGLFWTGQSEELKKTISFSSNIILLFSTPVLIAFIFFPHFFLSFFGSEFIEGSNSLIILTIGQFINSIMGSVGVFFNMTGNQKIFSKIVLLTALINIILNFILIPKLGITGAAISTTISLSLWNIIGAVYIKLKFGISTYCNFNFVKF